MKIPDFAPERWAIYAAAAVAYLVTALGLDVSDNAKFIGAIVLAASGIIAEAIASAITRNGRSRHLTGSVLER